MNLIKNILTKNDCYKAGRKIAVKGLMLHSVGCSQPKAEVFMNAWNKPGIQVCVHGFIDGNTGTVYQTLPWDHRAWHCGASGNNTHIGVEMCEPATTTYTTGANFIDNNPAKSKEVVMRTYNAAVELFAYLCKEYKLDPMKDIVSHAEGCAKGIASAHGDPDHLWSKYGLSMDIFRKAVRACMTNGTTAPTGKLYRVQVGAFSVKANAEKMANELKAKGYSTIIKEE